MRRPPGKITTEVDAVLDQQAQLRVLTKTMKQIAYETGLNRSTIQSHLARRISRERQKVVSHGTSETSSFASGRTVTPARSESVAPHTPTASAPNSHEQHR